MRIALFTDTFLPQVNGVARTLGRWVIEARVREHAVAVISPRIPGADPPDADLHIDVPSIPFPFYPELRVAAPPGPWEMGRLRAFAPDIVHVATEFGIGWAGAAFADANHIPLVTSFHTDFPAYLSGYGFGGLERLAWDYLRAFHRRARVTFCPSHATLAQLKDAGFRNSVRIWSRGVDAVNFTPARRSGAVRSAIAPGARRILLYVGRLAPEKRLDVLLDAFPIVHEQIRDVALVIVGHGPAADELRRRQAHGVHFTGYLTGEALADAYAAADAFVFPSDTETFGNVVVEALASGLPVISANRGGVTDTVRPGVNGLLVPAGDTAAFADAMLRLLADDRLHATLAANARAGALERNWNRVFDELFREYETIMAVASPARVA